VVSQLRQRGNDPLQNAIKGIVYAYTPPWLLTYHAFYITKYDNRIQNGPTIIMGLLKLRVLRQNPPVGSVPPKENGVRDKVTQRVASSWHTRDPIEGDRYPQALYLSRS
jgi:hypothetical protein